MLMFTLKLWFGLSVLVAGLAYYHRPQFPETANNRMLKQFIGLYTNFVDLTNFIVTTFFLLQCTLGSLFGFNRIETLRAMMEGPSKMDKKDDSVEEYTTTMDGVEVMVFRPAGSRDKLLPGIIHYHGGGWVFLTPSESAGGNLVMAATLRLIQDDDDSLPSLRFMSLDYPALQMIDLNLPSYRQYETGPGLLFKRRMLHNWLLYSVGQPEDFDYLYSNLCANNHTSRDVKTSELYSKCVAQSLVPAGLSSGSQSYTPARTENQDVIERLERFATDIYFSPLATSDKQLSRLPPTYIINAEFDVLRDEGFILAERLKKVGVTVEHKYYPTEKHGFLSLVDLDPLATEEAVNFGRYFNKTINSV